MKTVHTSDMVAHLWAHQSQSNARNSSNSFSFDGPVCYSYRTPIAMLHETTAGRVALITSDGYSMTTKSKHLGPVRHALRDLAHSFSVPYVGAYGGMAPRDPWQCRFYGEPRGPHDNANGWHALNVAYLVKEYTELGGRIRRAQYLYGTSTAADVLDTLERAALIVREYCEAFGLDVPALDCADDARVIWRAREIREEKRKDPKEIAKRQKARAASEARKEAKEAAKRAEEFERNATAIERFRAGAPSYTWRCNDAHGGALLRFDAADDTVRTSWGAEFPAEHARHAFPLIARARAAGKEWRPNGHTLHMGTFAVTEIRADGTVRAGCHTVYWSEIEACAKSLGLTE